MHKKIATLIISALSIVGLAATPVLAWTYGLSGSGSCQPDGSFKITWTIDNTTENQDLTVKASSNTAVVPVSTQVTAGQTADFTETESGTNAPATYNLTLNVTWPGDQNDHIKSADVPLSQACTQPTPPPTPPSTPPTTGGRGGGITTTATTPQVTLTPSAPINAGEGGASRTNPLALGGLLTSLGTVGIGLGIKRFKVHGFKA